MLKGKNIALPGTGERYSQAINIARISLTLVNVGPVISKSLS
ncbi:hypothetical protein AZZ62_002556, partial [Klebsiella variicola]